MSGSLSYAPEVVTLTPAAAPEIIDVLAEAFFDYPVMRFVLGTEPDYPARLHALVRLFVTARALRLDPMAGIYAGENLCAAATMSYPQDSTSPPAFAELREATWQQLGNAARERYNRCVEAWIPLSPDVPQLHVNMIGVRGALQGKGCARRLLEYVHELSRGSPASTGVSLTTELAGNVALYQHFGYHVVGHTRIAPELETWSFFRPDADSHA